MTDAAYWRELLAETKEYMRGLIHEALDEIEPLVDAIAEEPALLARWQEMATRDPDALMRMLESRGDGRTA